MHDTTKSQELNGKSTEGELIAALAKLKNSKACGNSHILATRNGEDCQLGCRSEVVLASLLEPSEYCVGGGKSSYRDWSNSVLIPER